MEINEEKLWDLVDRWRAEARRPVPGPFLSSRPLMAYGQAMYEAATDLGDLILELEDEAEERSRVGLEDAVKILTLAT